MHNYFCQNQRFVERAWCFWVIPFSTSSRCWYLMLECFVFILHLICSYDDVMHEIPKYPQIFNCFSSLNVLISGILSYIAIWFWKSGLKRNTKIPPSFTFFTRINFRNYFFYSFPIDWFHLTQFHLTSITYTSNTLFIEHHSEE